MRRRTATEFELVRRPTACASKSAVSHCQSSGVRRHCCSFAAVATQCAVLCCHTPSHRHTAVTPSLRRRCAVVVVVRAAVVVLDGVVDGVFSTVVVVVVGGVAVLSRVYLYSNVAGPGHPSLLHDRVVVTVVVVPASLSSSPTQNT